MRGACTGAASFDEFAITGAGLNAEPLNRLNGMQVKDRPLTLGFRFKVADPYHRVFKGDMGKLYDAIMGKTIGKINMDY